jgi:hypothetical protein
VALHAGRQRDAARRSVRRRVAEPHVEQRAGLLPVVAPDVGRRAVPPLAARARLSLQALFSVAPVRWR